MASEASGKKHGYRSGLESKVAKQLSDKGLKVEYETYKIAWTLHKECVYTPDFMLPNNIIIETKGRFVTADRMKHLDIRKQYPDLDIRFVFTNPNAKLSKTSSTTYAMWCDKHKFKYAKGLIPEEWLDE